MYFSKATALAIIAAIPTVLGTPILDTRQNGVTCQTSSGSPLTDDVTAVINDLNGRSGNCPQTNDKASGESFSSLSRNQSRVKKVLNPFRLHDARPLR